MRPKHSILAIATAVVSFGALSSANAQYRGNGGVTRQAQNVDQLAVQLSGEFRAHYRHAPNYRHLASDASLISGSARRIQHLARNGNTSPTLLHREVTELDKLTRHLQDMVRDSHRGRYGAARGSHVQRLLGAIGGHVNALRGEVASMQRNQRGGYGGHGHGPGYGQGSGGNPIHDPRGGRR